MGRAEPWLILEIKKSSFPTSESLETYLDSLLERAESWVPLSRRMALVAMEDRHFLPAIQARFRPENIYVQPEGWGNSIAVFLMLIDVERRNRDAQVVYLCGRPTRREASLEASLRLAYLRSLEHPTQLLLLGYRSTAGAGSSEADWLVPGNGPGVDRPISALIHSQDLDFANHLSRQGALREVGVVAGDIGIFLLSYMLAQTEMIRLFLGDGKNPGAKNFTVEVSVELSLKTLRRDILRENLSLLRCLPTANPGFDDAQRGSFSPARSLEISYLKSRPPNFQTFLH
ncbi:MAG TPA: hypothetical protein VJP40_08200 [bacterium]|nr:hypothetical protein [bacterium]